MIPSRTIKTHARTGRALIGVGILCGVLAACAGGAASTVTLADPQRDALALMRSNGTTPVFITGSALPGGADTRGILAETVAQTLSQSVTRTRVSLIAPQAQDPAEAWQTRGIRLIAAFDPGTARRSPGALCRQSTDTAAASSPSSPAPDTTGEEAASSTAVTLSLCVGDRLDAAARTIGALPVGSPSGSGVDAAGLKPLLAPAMRAIGRRPPPDGDGGIFLFN